jgi:hypothetical protein
VPEAHHGLCHACGSTEFEWVDDSHIRCVECGHGATVARLTAVANRNRSPEVLAQAEDRMRAHDAQTEAAFRGASFRPYALDAQWQGLRFFGGSGRSGDRITSLSLAFGDDPRDLASPQVRIETRVSTVTGVADLSLGAKMDALMLARQQVGHLWRQTGVLRDEIRRSAFPRDRARTEDPTLAWDRRLLPVDGGHVEFAVLDEGLHWVAQAIIEGTVVGIESRNWALETTGLRVEADFETYARGAQELRRRWLQQ